MRITSKQLRQIILEELIREAMSDDDDTVVPPSDILSKTYGGPGPVDDFGDSDDEEFEEDEEEDGFDAMYGHVSGILPDGRRLDAITEELIIRALEAQGATFAASSLFTDEEFSILPNSYDILETISAGGLMRNMKKVSSGGAGPTAQTASAWLKYLNENKADAVSILHKAIYETLKKAAAMGRIAMNDKKANMRWDAQEFYALPSGDINELKRRRR